MTDLEIDRKLALAIGWREDQIRCTPEFGIQVASIPVRSSWSSSPWWRGFSHKDWNVISPIAEKYDCFPFKWYDKWEAYGGDDYVTTDTPQAAIALAVIQGAGK